VNAPALALAALLAPVALAGLAAPARGEEILVVKSGDLGLYNRAVEGVLSSYRVERGEHVTLITLHPKDAAPDAAPPKGPDLPPDVIIAVGAAATRYAATGYPDTPIVYTMVVRPDRLPLTPHTIGISMFVPPADMVATLNLISPNIRYVGVLHGPEHSGLIGDAVTGLRGYETQLVPVEVDDERDLPQLARRLVRQVDALWVVPGTVTSLDAFQFLLKLSFEHRVPLVVDAPAAVRSGALLAITPDPVDLGRQAARLAGYMISGEALPPDKLFYPDMSNLAINLRTARSLGIRVPEILVEFASMTVQ
jgi:putative tryptophan/tyrosine transport system substrate-binding protein